MPVIAGFRRSLAPREVPFNEKVTAASSFGAAFGPGIRITTLCAGTREIEQTALNREVDEYSLV
jgi:hypothetical protein